MKTTYFVEMKLVYVTDAPYLHLCVCTV